MPIYMDGGSTSPESDHKALMIMLGIWIVLNICWIVSWVITIVKCKIDTQKWSFREAIDEREDGDYSIVADYTMLFLWASIAVCIAGYYVGQMFF